jgi:hypothetical protein
MRFAWILLLLASRLAAAETIALDKDGTLRAGRIESSVKYDEVDGPANTRLEVVSLGGKRRGIYLVTERHDGEDPPSRHQIFLYEKDALKLVFNQIISANRIVFSKHGTGRYVESGWSACMRDQEIKKKSVMRAKKHIILLRLDAKSTKMNETRMTSNEVVKCDELAG